MEFVFNEAKHADQNVTDPGQRQIFAVLDTLLEGLLQGARETFDVDGYATDGLGLETDDRAFDEVRYHLSLALGHAHSTYWDAVQQIPENVAHAKTREAADRARIDQAQAALGERLGVSSELSVLLRALDLG